MKPVIKCMVAFVAITFGSFLQAEVQTIGNVPHAFNDGIAVGKKGKIYVSNAGDFGAGGLQGTTVYSIDKKGEVGTAVEGMSGPLGTALDRRGNLYVSNYNTGAVFKKSKHGKLIQFSEIIGGGGIAINARGEVFVASYQGKVIYKIDRRGNAEVFSDDPLLAGGPVGISFGKRGNLYVGNYDDGKVLKIDRRGNVTQIATLDIAGNHAAYLVYASGNLYSTSLFTNKIYKITLDGTVTEFAGSGEFGNQDGDNETAKFALPNGITTNKKQDTLYISEYYSSYIRAITLD